MATPYLIGGNAASSATALTITAGTAVPVGDMVVVGASAFAGSTGPTAVTDSRGNTYTQRVTNTAIYPAGAWTSVLTTALTTSDTITVTFSSSTAPAAVAIGLPGGGTVDVTANGFGAGTTPSVTTGTLSHATETVVAFFTGAHAGGAWSWTGTGFTESGNASAPSGPYTSIAYDQVASTSPVTASPSHSFGDWTGLIVTVIPETVKAGAAALAAHASLTAAPATEAPAALSAVSSLTAAGGNPASAFLAASSSLTAAGTVIYQAAAALTSTSRLTAVGGLPDAVVVNQWSASFSQPVTWGDSAPGLQSVVVPLDPSSSVGAGTGYPSPGNWLFAIIGWNGTSTPATVGVGDDTHAWWRPAPPSSSGGLTRTTIWYTANLDIAPQFVYVSPSGYVDGLAVLVIEVTGLGPWDVVSGTDTAYANAATSLTLSVGAPAAESFCVAAVTADSLTAGTAFPASGFTRLAAVTSANGSDSSGDVFLAAACKTITTSASVSASSSASEDLSGFMLAVLSGAPSPVPADANPAWAWVVFEAGFGSGYQTPPDEITWTNLQTAGTGYRLRGWDETTGVQYELSTLESSELELVLDNPDGALSPWTPTSPYYPDVVPGTPVRMRAIAPGGTRWYVIQRNMERWPQSWDSALRGISNATGNDVWSVANKDLPVCYRAEILNEPSLVAWWPCDDTAINGPPSSLANAAPGNTSPLQINVASGGLTSASQDEDLTVYVNSSTQAFGTGTTTDSSGVTTGWMYGDSLSAAWSQTGSASATTGRYLTCTPGDGFPSLSGGVTVEGWFRYDFAKIAVSNEAGTRPGQPSGDLTLWDLGNGVSLSLDSGGGLQFTYGGATTSVYDSIDLRNTTWFGVTVTMTGSAWTVYLNAGITAQVSGTGSAGDGWGTFTAAGTAAGAGIGNASYSHLAVYSEALPAARVLAHFTAAYTAFGQLPAPQSADVTFEDTAGGGAYAPDGNFYRGSFFTPVLSIRDIGNAAVAIYVNATAGDAYSSVQPVETYTWNTTSDNGFMWATATSQAAPGYQWYVSGDAGQEQAYGTSVADYLYVDGYGSGATPPASPSALGDTAGQRVERIAQAGGLTVPVRCIDPSPEPVLAELDTGGQACGDGMSNIAQSDQAFLFVDNLGAICYWQRSHLASQPVRWVLGEGVTSGQNPYLIDAGFDTDPQQVKNDIEITQFNVNTQATAGNQGLSTGSGEATGGLVYGPSADLYPQVLASQELNGTCGYQLTSYLQNPVSIQAQADWIFTSFGTPVQRVTNLTVEAAGTADVIRWQFVLGANVGDVIQVTRANPGQPAFTILARITRIHRKIDFGAKTAQAQVIADYYPPSYWGLSPVYEDMQDEVSIDILDMGGGVME